MNADWVIRQPGLVLLCGLITLPLHAMDFQLLEEDPQIVSGTEFPARISVLATGTIVAGDAKRLSYYLGRAGRDQYGNKTLLLHSPGGSVAEALAMVAIMDDVEVTTVIPDGGVCASACASILFVSGRIHRINGTGALGFHSCVVGEDIKSSVCNEAIAQNASFHGTSFMPIESLLEDGVGQNKEQALTVISGEQACMLGLCGPPSADTTLAIPSFDCKKASKSAERMICNDLLLARYDASMSAAYYQQRKLLTENKKARLRAEQIDFLTMRDKCGRDRGCLLEAVSSRRLYLKRTLTDLEIQQEILKFEGSDELKISTYKGSFLIRAICDDPSQCGRRPTRDGLFELSLDYMELQGYRCRHTLGVSLEGDLVYDQDGKITDDVPEWWTDYIACTHT